MPALTSIDEKEMGLGCLMPSMSSLDVTTCVSHQDPESIVFAEQTSIRGKNCVLFQADRSEMVLWMIAEMQSVAATHYQLGVHLFSV